MKTRPSTNDEVLPNEFATLDNNYWQVWPVGSEPQLDRPDRLRHFRSLKLNHRSLGHFSGPLVLAVVMVIGALAVTDSSSIRESQQLDIAPAASGPSIDGAQPAYCGSTSYTSCTAYLTTSNANDLVMAFCTVSSGSLTPSIQDTGGHKWRIRDYNSADPVAYEWYTTASSPLTSDAITCSTTSDININLIVFGVSGANLNAPFDPSPSFPYTYAGTGGTPSVGVELATSPELVIGLIAEAGGPGCGYPSDGSGFSTITLSGNPPCNVAEYAATSATGSYTVDFGSVGSRPYSFFADAIEAVTTPGVALEGVATGYCAGSTSCTSTPLTTYDSGDLVIAFCTLSSGSLEPSISDSSNNAWTPRASTQGDPRGFEDYAASAYPLSGDAVTCGTTSSININIIVFAVSGVNLNAPFDPSSSFPYAADGTGGSPSQGVSQSFAYDFLFGLVAEGGGAGCSYPTLESSFSLIASSGSPPCNVGEFERTAATGSYTVGFGSTDSRPYDFIVDAVQASTTPDAEVSGTTVYVYQVDGSSYGYTQILGVQYMDTQVVALYTGETYSVTGYVDGAFSQWIAVGGSIGSDTSESTTFTPTVLQPSLSIVGTDPIWGGYIQSGASITKVSASIIVPNVGWDSTAGASGTEVVAFWVGVGGVSGTGYLWQAGVVIELWALDDVVYLSSYCAFYEYAVSPSSPMNTPSCGYVSSGTSVTMTVTFNPTAGDCYYAVNDTTDGGWQSGSINSCYPDGTTADIVAESPVNNGGPARFWLPDFGKPTFSNVFIQDGSTAWYVLEGALDTTTETVSTQGGNDYLGPYGLLSPGTDSFVVEKTGA